MESSPKDYSSVDFIVVPCQLLLPDIGMTEETIPEECIRDKKQQEAYLNSVHIHVMLNDQEFMQKEYNENSIKKVSKIVSYQVPALPVWFK